MSNIKTKELIICIISIVALVLAITTNVFAAGVQDLNALLGNTSNNDFGQIPEITNNTVNTNTNTNINTNTNVNANVNVNKNTNNTTNTMPNTGVSYSSVVIIAICGISAIYAYKKIRDYNI